VVSSTLQIGSAFGTAAISGAFFGAIGSRAAPGDYAHAFQVSLAINALLMFVCIGLSVLLVRHQHVALRRSAQPV
jgi:succinate dehydrogenase hydrophobic anchor subunit